MNNPRIIPESKRLLEATAASGARPICWLVAPHVVDDLRDTLEHERKSKRSLISRIWHEIVSDMPVDVSQIHGVPVQANPALPYGSISLTCARDAKEPEENPFVRREPVAAPDVAEEVEAAPTLQDLSTSAGRVSASDILIKALEDVDELAGVVVLRIRRGGSIDLCANINRLELHGALQHAMLWSLQNGN